MALTYAKVGRTVNGNYKEKIWDFKADTTYTTGGYQLATADLEALTEPGVTSFLSFRSEKNTAGQDIAYDRTNNKLLFFLGSTEATTTVSTVTVRGFVKYHYSNYK